MAHESFEDPATAEVMNALFVNIKVDREERPDIDQLYMSALHALGEEIAGTQAETLAAFMDAVNAWLSARLQRGPQEGARLARVAEVWAAVNSAARDAEAYNLDRKPLVFSVFGQLAEAARA